MDAGVNFIDTADVYENRQSEAAVGRVVCRRDERIYTATKCGRFISPHSGFGLHSRSTAGLVERRIIAVSIPRAPLSTRGRLFGHPL